LVASVADVAELWLSVFNASETSSIASCVSVTYSTYGRADSMLDGWQTPDTTLVRRSTNEVAVALVAGRNTEY
jgi:hypothetical protein